jgi:hypothetical protein
MLPCERAQAGFRDDATSRPLEKDVAFISALV